MSVLIKLNAAKAARKAHKADVIVPAQEALAVAMTADKTLQRAHERLRSSYRRGNR